MVNAYYHVLNRKGITLRLLILVTYAIICQELLKWMETKTLRNGNAIMDQIRVTLSIIDKIR